MGLTGMSGVAGGVSLAKKKKKKKMRKKKRDEWEDPSLREHLLAGAYGGVAKPKPKRVGLKYTTDIDAGLRDIATPNMFKNDPSLAANMSKRSMLYPHHQGSDEDFSSARKQSRIKSRMNNNSSIDDNQHSNLGGSKYGNLSRGVPGTDSKALMDPQQREAYLKER